MIMTSRWRKRKRVGIALTLLLFLGYVLTLASNPVYFMFHSDSHKESCTLPVTDPFDKSLKKYFWKPAPLVCDSGPSLVVVDFNNTLRINMSAMGFYKVDDAVKLVCEVREVDRDDNDKDIKFSDTRMVYKLPFRLTHDFNHVMCKTKSDIVVFDNVVHGIHNTGKQTGTESETELSVLLFGVDSVARSAAFRYLPKTVQYLKELGAYDFKGFMKVGDGTFQNLLPLLTGNLVNEEECPGYTTTPFDNLPFLWKNFSSRRYATVYAEDLPSQNTFNNFHYKGFRKQPTDHYMRPFWLGLSSHDALQYKLSDIYRFLEDKGVKVGKSSVFCNQNTPNHEVQVNYIKQFFQFYKGKRKFAFSFLTELGHDFINFLNYGDDIFVDFLKWLKMEGFLDRTIFVLFGDHGSRYRDIRNTYIGRIESRMPLLNIVIPEHLKRKYPSLHKSLTVNTERLITMYDLRQTLVDVANSNFDKPSKQVVKGMTRGISLFQPINKDRSCLDAMISTEFCACYKSKPIDIDKNPEVRTIGEQIVEHINNLLIEHKQCEKLALSTILRAEQRWLGLKHTGDRYYKYSIFRFSKPETNRRGYSVSIQTVPGDAYFEAYGELTTGSDFRVLGSIERTNMYGNQSICVSERSLKLYCFCKINR